MALLTTDDMVRTVRNQCDEDSESDLSTADIIDALNRGMDYGCNIIARHSAEPLIQFTDVTTTVAGVLDLPAGIFEDRIVHLDLVISGIPKRLEFITSAEFWQYDNLQTTTQYPRVWSLVGRKIYLRPNAAVGTIVRVWHTRVLDGLVKSQGRITRLGADYFILDAYAGGLSTSVDALTSYFNVVGFNTGVIKATFQVSNIVANKISFRAVPTRTTVLDHTVVGAFASADPAIRVDDYICEAAGTAIPFFPKPLTSFMIQYAVVEIKNRLGMDVIPDKGTLAALEAQLVGVWGGRPNATRILSKSINWRR